MAYTKNLQIAADRHYEDARRLQTAKRFDNAGYHFGLAAECAIKQRLLDCGTRVDDLSIWKHWPELKDLALLALSGRQAGPARALLERGSFMQRWDIVMRYSDNGDVDEEQAARWQSDANEAIGLII